MSLSLSCRKAKLIIFEIARATLLLALVLVITGLGCKRKTQQPTNLPIPDAADLALRESPQLTLLSLDPDFVEKDEPVPRLHGFHILGDTVLSPADRERVIQTFRHDIGHFDNYVALCFHPRHAIRATNKGATYDFVICYECSNVEVFDPRDGFVQLGITGSGKVFNEILTSANIPISWRTEGVSP